MSDARETAKAEALKKAWAQWFRWDYSWEGLAEKEAEGFDSLQAYWRIDPETQRLRSDTELRAAGELIEVGGQKTYHLAHLPLHYPDGSPTRKTTAPVEAQSHLDALIRARLIAAAPEGEADTAVRAALVGAVVLDLDLSRRALATPIFADWSFGIFAGTVDFTDATFTGYAGFEVATFTGDAEFSKATFTGDAVFEVATFTGDAGFSEATFTGTAGFSEATFTGTAGFGGATFTGTAGFGGATFTGDAWFGGATFTGTAGFSEATFTGTAGFSEATFTGTAGFAGATFTGYTGFRRATFTGYAGFRGATFTGTAGFEHATFTGTAGFEHATFTGTAGFSEATFTGTAWFEGATFTGDAGFDVKSFGAFVNFRMAQFKRATFGGRFVGSADFQEAVMGGPFRFSAQQDVPETGFLQAFRGAKFSDIADFTGAGTRLVGAFDHAIFEKTLILDQVADGEADDEFTHTILLETLKGDPETLDSRLAALEGGCRTVKVAMGKARDEGREQRYYRYQLLARRKRPSTPWPEKLVSWLYWATSNYGSSFLRQPVSLVLLIIFFAPVFVIFDRPGLKAAFILRYLPGDNIAAAFYLSALNVLRPFAVWSDLPKVSMGAAATPQNVINAWIRAFFDVEPLGFRLLCSLESFLAIVLLFLFVLAVRRKFQIS